MIANLFGPDLGYVVIIVLVVLVGGSQLPKIARNIGTAGKEFRRAQQEAEEEAAQRDQAAQSQPGVHPAQGAPSPAALAPPTDGASAADPPHLSLSQDELDAILKAHEDQVRRGAAG